MEADNGVMQSQVKEHQCPQKPGQRNGADSPSQLPEALRPWYLAMTALGNEYTAFPLCQSDWVAGLHPCLQDGVSLSAKRVTAVHSRTDTSLHLGQ